jgi:hypothetical protein
MRYIYENDMSIEDWARITRKPRITNNVKKWERKNAIIAGSFADYNQQKAGELSEVVNKTPLSNKLTERIPNLGNTDFGFN